MAAKISFIAAQIFQVLAILIWCCWSSTFFRTGRTPFQYVLSVKGALPTFRKDVIVSTNACTMLAMCSWSSLMTCYKQENGFDAFGW